MIEYIKGRIDVLNPTEAIVETGGIGYEICISLTTFTAIQTLTECKLFIHEIIREDTHQLFGFSSLTERSLFRQLIGVSGVGANTARMILSSLQPQELESVIVSGDSKRLKGIKGIGAKTAERIIVDLRDKIKPSGDTLLPISASSGEVYQEALSALVMLGFPRPQSQKALSKIFDADPAVTVEAAIKRALSML